MTAEEAKRNQDELAKNFNLGYWYGTECEKCCGVYPKFRTGGIQNNDCWYECEVCCKRTEPQKMPWIAAREWNAGKFMQQQLSLF